MPLSSTPSSSVESYDPLARFSETVLENRFIPHDPHPKQAEFLLCPHIEGFYGGAAGGGKSDALLMGALQYAHVPGYSAIIFRKTYKQLSLPNSIMDRAVAWLAPHKDVQWRSGDHTFLFPSGAKVVFAHLQHEKDKESYLGPEFQFIGFDELTAFSQSQYRFLFGRLRRVAGLDVPLRMRSASNPGGPGHMWVMRRFVEPKVPDENRIFIPATIDDNPSLSKTEYENTLQHLDPITRAQMMRGDWTARQVGGKFRAEWFRFTPQAPAYASFVRFWDLAATEPSPGNDPDWTVGALVGEYAGQFFIADIKRVRRTPKGVQDLIRETALMDGLEVPVWMEQEPGASGPTTIDHYRRNVLLGFDFRAMKSSGRGSKEIRANPVSSATEGGNVFLIGNSPWIDPFIEECEAFPNAEHDDQVDAVSGAFSVLAGPSQDDVEEELAGAEEPFDMRSIYDYLREF